MTNKIIGGCIRNAFCRYNDWIKNLCGLRSHVRPFNNYVEHQEREVSTRTIEKSPPREAAKKLPPFSQQTVTRK